MGYLFEDLIRRWMLENDWVEAIIALPTDLFYNTGIQTYIWLLTNRKDMARRGKVQLIDTTDFGYREIHVERPRKLAFVVTDDAVETLRAAKPFLKLSDADQADVLEAVPEPPYRGLSGVKSMFVPSSTRMVGGVITDLWILGMVTFRVDHSKDEFAQDPTTHINGI